jgi:hypothetical protein
VGIQKLLWERRAIIKPLTRWLRPVFSHVKAGPPFKLEPPSNGSSAYKEIVLSLVTVVSMAKLYKVRHMMQGSKFC